MKKLLFIPLALCLLIACNKDDDDNKVKRDTSVLVPLTAGNSWTYEVKALNEAGKLQVAGTQETKVIEEVELSIEGKSVKAMKVLGPSGIEFVNNGTEGMYKYGIMVDLTEEKQKGYAFKGSDTILFNGLLGKYPVQKNEEWTFNSCGYSTVRVGDTVTISSIDAKETIKCIATEKKISVAAGDFTCYVFESSNLLGGNHYYYESGVGMVKFDILLGGTVIKSMELKSFVIK